MRRSAGAPVALDPNPHLLHALAATCLETANIPGLDEPMAQRDWAALQESAETQRAWPSVAKAIDQGHLLVGEEQRALAVRNAKQVIGRTLELDRLLLELHSALEAEALPHQALKGPAHAVLYPDESLRPYLDIDLLVPAEQFLRTISFLRDAGLEIQRPSPTPEQAALYGKGKSLHKAPDFDVDIHRTIADGPFGLAIDLSELTSRPPRHIEVGSQEIAALDLAASYLHACYHAVLPPGRRRLTPMLDVAVMLDRALVEPGDVLDLAHRWRGAAVVADATRQAADLFSLSGSRDLRSWADTYTPSRRERRWRATYDPTGRFRRVSSTIAEASALNTASERAGYVRSVLFHAGHDPWPTRIRRALGT